MRTFSEFLDRAGGIEALPVLQRIGTGSWIHGSMGTWAANSEQRRGWAFLAEARARCGPSKTLDPLHLAEASDWFWWLSDDHHTDQQDLFVRLFSASIRKGCREASVPEPEGLSSWAARLSKGNNP
jgi:alpha-amylase/alpha-mannosidase (GH57 family)